MHYGVFLVLARCFKMDTQKKVKLVGCACAVFACMVFIMYCYKLGGISTKAADWGEFGSLLAGVAAVPGTLGTFFLLWYTISENRERYDALVNIQMKNEQSQEYREHKENFFTILDESREALSPHDDFMFIARGAIYRKLFPHNSYRGVVDENDLDRFNILLSHVYAATDIVLRYDISSCFEADEEKKFLDDVDNLFSFIYGLTSELGIEFTSNKIGDIRCYGAGNVAFGVNLFDCSRVFHIFDVIMDNLNHFVGNTELRAVRYVDFNRLKYVFWRFQLAPFFSTKMNFGVIGTVTGQDIWLSTLLYLAGSYRRLPEDYEFIGFMNARLLQIFSSPLSVREFNEPENMLKFIGKVNDEIRPLLNGSDTPPLQSDEIRFLTKFLNSLDELVIEIRTGRSNERIHR